MRPGNKNERAVCKADGSFKHMLLNSNELKHVETCFVRANNDFDDKLNAF